MVYTALVERTDGSFVEVDIDMTEEEFDKDYSQYWNPKTQLLEDLPERLLRDLITLHSFTDWVLTR